METALERVKYNHTSPQRVGATRNVMSGVFHSFAFTGLLIGSANRKVSSQPLPRSPVRTSTCLALTWLPHEAESKLKCSIRTFHTVVPQRQNINKNTAKSRGMGTDGAGLAKQSAIGVNHKGIPFSNPDIGQSIYRRLKKIYPGSAHLPSDGMWLRTASACTVLNTRRKVTEHCILLINNSHETTSWAMLTQKLSNCMITVYAIRRLHHRTGTRSINGKFIKLRMPIAILYSASAQK